MVRRWVCGWAKSKHFEAPFSKVKVAFSESLSKQHFAAFCVTEVILELRCNVDQLRCAWAAAE
jgi:hypothetical protein